jgi:hypothetical protein
VLPVAGCNCATDRILAAMTRTVGLIGIEGTLIIKPECVIYNIDSWDYKVFNGVCETRLLVVARHQLSCYDRMTLIDASRSTPRTYRETLAGPDSMKMRNRFLPGG